MARDWSKEKRRPVMRRWYDGDEPLDDLPMPGPSKAELRQEADALTAAFHGRIKRLPTFAALRCRSCGHRGTARVPAGRSPAFKCSQCGSSLIAWRT